MPDMRKPAAVLGIVAAALILGFVAWSFSLHGTIGLYRVNGTYKLYFNAVIVLGVLMFGLSLLLLVARRLWAWARRSLSVVLLVLAVPGIVLPPVAFVYVGGIPLGNIGDTRPQLLLADGVGKYGIPNMAIVFNTSKPERAQVGWGATGISGETPTESTASRQHVVMMRDLQPDTDYLVQVGKVYYKLHTPSLDGPLHFAVGSDAHFGAGNQDATEKMLHIIVNRLSPNPFEYFFLLGDTVQHGFSVSQWHEAFQTLTPATSVVPTRFAIGNHDTLFTGLRDYEKYCYPQGMDLQTGSRLWYRIVVGKVHFLVIDLEWSAESFTSRQAAWLEDQLKSIPVADWKIVMGHGFYYASGSFDDGWQWYDNPETIKALTPLFEKYGVDLVFSGHAHQMELLQKSGVTYVICGGFGGLPDQAREYTSPQSLWYASGQYGFMDVSVSGNQATLVFRTPDNAALKTAVVSRSGNTVELK